MMWLFVGGWEIGPNSGKNGRVDRSEDLLNLIVNLNDLAFGGSHDISFHGCAKCVYSSL